MGIDDELDDALLEEELAEEDEEEEEDVEEIGALPEEPSGEEYLLALGYERGHITYEDILRVFPEAEEDVDRLDEIIGALMESGITVGGVDGKSSERYIEIEEDEEKARKRRRTSAAPSK